MESELRVFVENEGYFTIRELITDEDGFSMIGLNPLIPMGESIEDLKTEIAEYITAFAKPFVKEGDYDYFTLEIEEKPDPSELH